MGAGWKRSWIFSTACLWILLGWVGIVGADPTQLLKRDLERLSGPRSFGLGTASFALAGLAHQWDDQVKGEIDNGAVDFLLEGVDLYGSSSYSLALGLGMWGVAKLANWSKVEAVSSDLVRAAIVANIVVQPLKLIVGRRRPDGTNNFSFPSGHSANAFAMTAVLNRRFGPKVGVPLYAVTLLVPVARVHFKRHHFSDVVAGASLGCVVGYTVNLQQVEGEVGSGWNPIYIPGRWLLGRSCYF